MSKGGKKKGLSMDEKMVKTVEYLCEQKVPFTLKELEAILPKAKGIVWKTVKEILVTLVAEGKVYSDKVGPSTLFWCFPATQSRAREKKVKELRDKIVGQKRKRDTLKEELKSAKVGKKESDDRTSLLEEYGKLKTKDEKLQGDIKQYESNDPDFIAKIQDYAELSKDAANRWTEAVINLKSWAHSKFNVEEAMLDKQFGIPEDFDYIG
eukprot:TRINITY_DN112438_c0_g1_i1.p1 TRINITY_DN112438_c0_g1~~TRINITY_DN112438_c0_g1_i1.p1  ORF type:complete len:209 (-),score=26.89 TRINITY_DN112438_c0_g1_i1:228-854(-)